MREQIKTYAWELLADIASADTQLVLLVVLIVITVIVLDSISSFAKTKRDEVGVSKNQNTLSIDGSKTMPVRQYVSEIQGLSGAPDALISENSYIIPVERKPLAKKIRDRYVAQLLVYMRLVEEFEGKKPPYGYLILGPNCRRFKIENSPERQAWLQQMLDEMRSILDGQAATATPQINKCKKCAVRDACDFKISQVQQINKKVVN